MSEQNKVLSRSFFAQLDERRDIPDELCAPDLVVSFEGMPRMDLAGFRGFARAFFDGFPDLRHSVEEVITEADRVVTRVQLRGTNTGSFMGMPPTGKACTFLAVNIARVEGGRLKEIWILADQMGMMQQLGAVPAPNS